MRAYISERKNIVSLEIDWFPESVDEVDKRDLYRDIGALRMVIMTEQKIENPWAPFNPFQTEFLSSVVIQLDVTKR